MQFRETCGYNFKKKNAFENQLIKSVTMWKKHKKSQLEILSK